MNLGTLIAKLIVDVSQLQQATAGMNKLQTDVLKHSIITTQKIEAAQAEAAAKELSRKQALAAKLDSINQAAAAKKIAAEQAAAAKIEAINAASAARIAAIQAQAQAQLQARLASSAAMAAAANGRVTPGKIKTAGRDMAMGITVPAAFVGGAGLSAFKDYELTLAHISGLTGTSAEQTRKWSDALKQIAPAIGKGPQELVEALYYIASSGIEAEKAMEVLNVSARASAAGLGSTQQVADLLTSALNAYADSDLTAAAAADMLTAAVREGKIEAAAFATHVGYAIPLAAEMGVTFDQAVGAIAAMSTTGADASTAATQLRQVLSDMIKPAKQSEAALRRMGSSSQELRDLIENDGLLAALNRVRELVDQFGKTAMGDVFPDVRSLTGVLMLVGQNAEHVKEIFDATKNSTGDMEKALAFVTSTLDMKFNQSLSTARIALIDLGSSLKGAAIGMLNTFAKVIRDLSEWFNSLDEGTRKFIVTTVALAAVLGPAIYVVGSIVQAYTALKAAIVATNVSMTILNTTMKLNPIMLLLGAVAAGITLFSAFSKEANKVADAQKEISKQVSTEAFQLNSLFEAAKDVNRTEAERIEAINTINSNYGQYLNNLLDEKSTLDDITKAQQNATRALIAHTTVKLNNQKINELQEGTSKKFSNEFSRSIDAVRKQYGSARVSEFVSDVFEEANKSAKGGDMAWFDSAIKMYDRWFKTMEGGEKAYNQFYKSFREFVGDVKESSSTIDKLQAINAGVEGINRSVDKRANFSAKLQSITALNDAEVAALSKSILQEIALVEKAYDTAAKKAKEAFDQMQKGGSKDDFNKLNKDKMYNEDYLGKLKKDSSVVLDELAKRNGKKKTGGSGGAGGSGTDPVADWSKKLNQEMSSIAKHVELAKAFGDTYDENAAYLRVFNSALDEGIQLLPISDQRIMNLAIASRELSASETAMKKYAEGMDQMTISTKEYILTEKEWEKLFGKREEKGDVKITQQRIEPLPLPDLDELINVNKEMNRVRTSIDSIIRSHTLMGDSTIGTSEAMEFLVREIDRFKKKGEEGVDMVRKLTEELKKLQKQAWEQNIVGQLSFSNDMMKTHGKSGDPTGGISLPYKSSREVMDGAQKEYAKAKKDYNQAYAAGERPGFGQGIDNAIERMEEAKKITTDVRDKWVSNFQNVADVMLDAVNIYNQYLDQSQEKSIKRMMAQAKLQGKTEEWIAAEREKIEKKYAKRRKAMAIIEATINTAVSVTKLLAIPPLAIAAGVLGAAQIALIASQPLAEGGIVPQGYPNDTYPARLTSGEVVVPPGKLDSIVGKGNNAVDVYVHGEVEGDKIVYIVDEVRRRRETAF